MKNQKPMFKLSEKSKRNLVGVDMRLVELFEKVITKSPIDFGIPEGGGFRTEEQQHTHFLNGKSKADGVTRKSKHQTGKAVDIYAFVNGKASWDKVHLAVVAGVVLSEARAMELDIVWGATFGSSDFKGWDFPHFELR